MTKSYLKMSDVFHGGERQYDLAGIGGVIDSNGEFILQVFENNYCIDMLHGDRSEYRDKVAKYAAHAINSHDELVHLRNKLLIALEAHEKFWAIREAELGELSPEAQAVRDGGLAAIAAAKEAE